MAVLQTIQGKCACLGAKSAHIVGHLPLLSQDSGGAMTAILTLFVREVSLRMVVAHPRAVNGDHLFPGARPRDFRVGHFSDDSEVRLHRVLPGLPRLDALFSHPQSSVDIHCLIALKLPTPRTSDHRWSAKGRERRKKHFQVIPPILGCRDLARQAGPGVVLQHTEKTRQVQETLSSALHSICYRLTKSHA